MLGMTEAGSTLLISADESDQPEHRRGSYGRPAPGFETRIVDPDTGQPVGHGAVGELRIRGPHLMQRYYRRSREECFDPDGWFHTGDLVRADPDGFVYFVGRRTSMIKTSGANVSPAEVERVIAKVTGGTVAHVVGIPDPDRGEIVAAVVVTDDPFDEEELRDPARSGTVRLQGASQVRRAVRRRGSRAVQRQGRPPRPAEGFRCLTPSTPWSGCGPGTTRPHRR